jgi:hypothetical protein
MLEVLGIRDPQDIVPLEDDIQPTDPVSENMDILNGKPVKAFEYQDHASHITVHMAMLQDPKIQEMAAQAPNADAIQAALSNHIIEHIGFEYRRQIEEEIGTKLPPVGEPLPPEIELRLSTLVAAAAQQLLGKNMQAAQMEQQQEQAQDPVLQMQQQELAIKAQAAQSKVETDEARIAADLEKARMKDELERIKIEAELNMAGAKLGTDISKVSAQERTKGAEIGRKITETLLKD